MTYLLMFFLSFAHAGYLRILSKSDLHLEKKGQSFELQGSYTIQNDGDETAKEVWPHLNLDQFEWKGYAQDLAAGESYTWEIRKQLTRKDFCLQVSKKCPMVLPMIGEFLIRVQKHYQDTNGYIFVIPDLVIVDIKSKNKSTSLAAELQINSEKSREYIGEYLLKSKVNQDLKISLQWLLPREMENLTEPIQIEVPNHGEVAGSFQFRNRSALPGSNYSAILVAEWVEDGERKVNSMSASFQVEQPSHAPSFLKRDRFVWSWLLWLTCLGFNLMWFFWIRPLQKF